MVGSTVSHYKIVGTLGAGGMSVVYEAQDTRLPRRVALKFLHGELSTDPLALARFTREAHALSRLNHPNICTIYDIGQADGAPFIVMERLEGGTLRERLNAGPIGGRELIDIAVQIAEALKAAHEKGIVHRDIKPGNVFITPQGVKVLDFGLAKPVETSASPTTDEATLEGRPVGTANYMSPEQIRQEPLDSRSDLFSMGVMLFEMATGFLPFKGNSVGETISNILERDPPSLTVIAPHHPPDLDRLVRELLAKEAADRCQSAEALIAELRALEPRFEAALPVAPRPAGGRRFHLIRAIPAWTYVASAVVIAIVAVASLMMPDVTEARFSARDTLLVADVENQTREPQLDAVLYESLVSELYQSPHVTLVLPETVREVLARMRLPADTSITESTAREIAAREGMRAILLASVAPVGDGYAVRARVVSATAPAVLASAVRSAASVDQTLTAAQAIARDVREQLGESLRSIDAHAAPLAAVTTQSLDALRLFTLGKDELANRNFHEALALFQRAIEIDREFAMAYHYAAQACANVCDFERLIAYESEAVRLSDRFGLRERLTIQADFYHLIDHYDRAISNYRLLTSQYPEDDRTLRNLGRLYWRNMQLAESIVTLDRALRLGADPIVRLELAPQYFKAGQVDAAVAVLSPLVRGGSGRERFDALLDSATFELGRGQLQETDRLLREARIAAGTDPAGNDRLAVRWADYFLAQGRYREALQALGSPPDGLDANPQREPAWRRLHRQVEVLLLSGQAGRARDLLRRLPDVPLRSQLWVLKGLASARAGDLRTAESVRAGLQRAVETRDLGPSTQSRVLMLDAEIAMQRGQGQRAVALARVAVERFGSAMALEVLARAQARGGDAPGAVDSYRRLLARGFERAAEADAPAVYRLTLARFELAQLLESLGQRAEAQLLYQEFLERWKDADPTLPALEVARLRSGRGAQSTPAGRGPTPVT
jgi:tetratricopeptide (TPR) repeat protein/tRNA A-37 threonylcarbamoyl transferase component Bud32